MDITTLPQSESLLPVQVWRGGQILGKRLLYESGNMFARENIQVSVIHSLSSLYSQFQILEQFLLFGILMAEDTIHRSYNKSTFQVLVKHFTGSRTN